jgi:hypothetical protein
VEWLIGALQWPVWADIQSGLRVRGLSVSGSVSGASSSWQSFGLPALDQMLTSPYLASGTADYAY